MKQLSVAWVTAIAIACSPAAHGQDASDVKKLKDRVTELEAKLRLAEKEIELPKKENDLLRAGKPVTAPKDKAESKPDTFAKDAVLTGDRDMGFVGAKKLDVHQSLTLTVTKRDGTKFEGELAIDKNKYNVTGTAPVGSGTVRFKTEKSGTFEQAFEGPLNNGRFSLKVSGVGTKSEVVQGTGQLKSSQ